MTKWWKDRQLDRPDRWTINKLIKQMGKVNGVYKRKNDFKANENVYNKLEN